MISGYNICRKPLNQIDFESYKIINTINSHSFCVAKYDSEFSDALVDSDLLFPDGIGIVLAEFFLNRVKIKKIAGFDIFIFLMNRLNNSGGSVFFLGSSIETLNKIKNKCSIDYPNISISSYSPPFKNSFSDKDSKIMVKNINDFRPDILFVGMTAPKQEKWVNQFKNQIKAKNICSVGAVFDFYAGNSKRAPKFIIKLGLEWLHRSINNRRLFVRNMISNPKFILYILKIKLFKK